MTVPAVDTVVQLREMVAARDRTIRMLRDDKDEITRQWIRERERQRGEIRELRARVRGLEKLIGRYLETGNGKLPPPAFPKAL